MQLTLCSRVVNYYYCYHYIVDESIENESSRGRSDKRSFLIILKHSIQCVECDLHGRLVDCKIEIFSFNDDRY